jgi:glycosyltransferase involved in cell wall biosynthesis
MKVLFLTHCFVRWKGDLAGSFLLGLAKKLKKRGIKILVVSPHEKGIMQKEIIEGIEVYRFRYAPSKWERLAYKGEMQELVINKVVNQLLFLSFMICFLIKSLKIVKKEKIGVIHSHWWIPSGVVGLVLSKMVNKPYIVTSHGTDVFMLKKFSFLKFLARLVFNNAKSVTVVSNSIKNILITTLKVSPTKINIFPMAAELNLFYPTPVKKREENIILSIGRFIELKGYKYLIEAIRILKKKGKKIKLMLIGEGPEEELLKEKVKLLGLTEEVEFVGFKPKEELNYFYNMCDVFVLPSVTDSSGKQEGLGLVLLEAMSCKKPVIGTKSGGIPDIIKNGKTGLLVEEKDTSGLAKTIERVLKDEKLATTLAQNGYKYVIENFTASKIARKIEKIYFSLLKNN